MTGRRIYRRGRIWWLRYRDLNYNSRGGFGQVGVGWTLGGLSTITRCPANYDPDGFRGTVSYDANDRFCLDGLRLVSISGAYGADGTEYRTERDIFAKVISYGDVGSSGDSPEHFIVQTKDGRTLEFGVTADSRIEAIGQPLRSVCMDTMSGVSSDYG